MSNSLFAADALLPNGWAKNVSIRWSEAGVITHVELSAPATGTMSSGPLIPGMPNLHSHAFQRAMAGLTEIRGDTQDSFWSWRTLMYRFASKLGPDQLEAIATWLYAEMLEAGFTSVCEFHYLHHDVDGKPYADDATLSHALLRAAESTGIGITLLPVLYQTSGFGALAPNDGQKRFIRSNESMMNLLVKLKPVCDAQGARLGVAPHSLRAVPPESLKEIIASLDAFDSTCPIHIHIAEQTKEVDDCIAWSGQRPVQWLLDHAQVDSRWCLVHATHMDASEYERAAKSGAVAGLCPTTEANLGDGIFEFETWRARGGVWGIGSDSNVCVNAAEELMVLEYGQRLATRQRSVGADATHKSVATAMTLAAVEGGAQASGRDVAGIAVGQRADFVVLDAAHISLRGLSAPDMLASHVFASHRSSAIESVYAGGKLRVSQGRHLLRDKASSAFIEARTQLLAD